MSSKELIEVVTTWIPCNEIDFDKLRSIARISEDNLHLIKNLECREQAKQYFKSGYSDKLYLIISEV